VHKSVACFAIVIFSRISFDAIIHPSLKPGANILEKVPIYTTLPRLSNDFIVNFFDRRRLRKAESLKGNRIPVNNQNGKTAAFI
jgi:hypothetical protein